MKDGPKLIVKLGRFRNVVLGYFVQMPEDWRHNIEAILGGFKLKSIVVPELNDGKLFLPGSDKTKDDHAFAYCCGTEEDACKQVEQIKAVVARANRDAAKEKDEVDVGLDGATVWQDLMETVE